VPSVSPRKTRGRAAPRLLAVVACLCLLGAGATGCSTTQEKAAAKQAESEAILKARAKRQAEKKRHKAAHKRHHSPVGGPKTQGGLEQSAHQQSGGMKGDG
jgi:uncharacterized protein HemX